MDLCELLHAKRGWIALTCKCDTPSPWLCMSSRSDKFTGQNNTSCLVTGMKKSPISKILILFLWISTFGPPCIGNQNTGLTGKVQHVSNLLYWRCGCVCLCLYFCKKEHSHMTNLTHNDYKSLLGTFPKLFPGMTGMLVFQWAAVIYPVQHFRPAFHGDALEHSQHSEQEVVKVGDAIVGPLPAISTYAAINTAWTSITWQIAGGRLFFC